MSDNDIPASLAATNAYWEARGGHPAPGPAEGVEGDQRAELAAAAAAVSWRMPLMKILSQVLEDGSCDYPDDSVLVLADALLTSEEAGADLIAQRRAHDVARTEAEAALTPTGEQWDALAEHLAESLDESDVDFTLTVVRAWVAEAAR